MAVGTTRGKRRLGRYIRSIMEREGLAPKEIAREARCVTQTVTRLLSGDSQPRVHLFLMILDAIRASADERQQALRLWEVADADATTIEHADELPVSYMRFRMDEREAVLERTLDTVIVPGLLQTAGYAAAKAARGRVRGTWNSDAEAAERRDRQGLLHREEQPLALHALIDEGALRRMVGGPKVMVEQLDHLLAVAKLRHITIQVIPFSIGAYGAMSGPLTILSFPEADEPDAVYPESLIGPHTVEEDDIAASDLPTVWDGAAKLALTSGRSASLIKKIRGELDGD